MLNRIDEIWTDLEAFIKERSVHDIEQATRITESRITPLLSDLRIALLSCNEQAKNLQDIGEKDATAYISLSFLYSSIITSKNDLRIDFYDNDFLIDISEACSYVSYAHLIPLYQDSLEIVTHEAEKRFTHLHYCEKDALSQRYCCESLYKMIMSTCLQCFLHVDMQDFWPQLDFSEDCAITFGGFLHDQRQILTLSQQAGAKAV